MKKLITIIAVLTMAVAACADSDVTGLGDPSQLTAVDIADLGGLTQNEATKVGNPLESIPDDSAGHASGDPLTEHAKAGVLKIATEGKLKEHDLWRGSLNGSDILVKFDIAGGYVHVITAKDGPTAQIQFFVDLEGVGSAEGFVKITVEPDGDDLDVGADGQKLGIVADEDYDELNALFLKSLSGQSKEKLDTKPDMEQMKTGPASYIYDLLSNVKNVKKIKPKDIKDPSEDD
jgi:hypothetical protein